MFGATILKKTGRPKADGAAFPGEAAVKDLQYFP
jgi:hypothetical protein